MAMSLLTYKEARPWAKAIRDEVLERQMPPFDPIKGVGDFRDDPSLSEPELELFVSWVEGGAPEGEPDLPPTVPDLKPATRMAAGKTLQIQESLVLRQPISVYGVVVDGPLELAARLPNETVQRLIWIREFHAQWNRPYFFRSPVLLPKGTKVFVYSRQNATAGLITTGPPES